MDKKKIKKILDNDFKKEAVKEPSDSRGRIKLVDLMATKNADAHHTSKFELVDKLKTPIFRRGQPFSLKIEFKEKFELRNDNLQLDFSFEKGKTEHLKVTGSKKLPEDKDWGVCVTSEESKSLNLEVKPSPTCAVGIWFLTVVTEPEEKEFEVPQHMYILFNPWCLEDDVYMEKENWRKEYVLNDQGILFKNAEYEHNWSFKQFDFAALTAALYVLLERGYTTGSRGDPKVVCQNLSNLDRRFIIEGRWDGKYDDGKSPMTWTSSYQILHQFMKTKELVKYGQCWCFAGIRTTLFRALGIPCRPTTIYHTGSSGVFVNIVVDASTGKDIGDLVGNFHVWNDAWMVRPDLRPANQKDYGGWQVTDSGELASLNAVKEGDIDLKYNTGWVFTYINAIEVLSNRLKDGKTVVEKIDKNSIGNTIVTKAVGEFKKQDIKLEYKHREGSKERRDVMERVIKARNKTDKLKELEQQANKFRGDVSFKITVPDSTQYGEAIRISVEAQNHCNVQRTMDFQVTAEAVDYRGVPASTLDRSTQPTAFSSIIKRTFNIAPFERKTYDISVGKDEYLGKLCDFGYVRIFAFGEVKETKHVSTKECTIVVKKSELTFEIADILKKLQEYTVKVKFTNPLDKELTECSLSFQASCNDFDEEDTLKQRNVKPRESVSFSVTFKPEVAGNCVLSAVFTSNLLKNLGGSKRVKVE